MLVSVREDVRIGITGIGAEAPTSVLANAEIGKRLGVTSDWIVERSGILERRIADAEETTARLASRAANSALEMAGGGPETVDVVIVATATPDAVSPATAALVAASVGATTLQRSTSPLHAPDSCMRSPRPTR